MFTLKAEIFFTAIFDLLYLVYYVLDYGIIGTFRRSYLLPEPGKSFRDFYHADYSLTEVFTILLQHGIAIVIRTFYLH